MWIIRHTWYVSFVFNFGLFFLLFFSNYIALLSIFAMSHVEALWLLLGEGEGKASRGLLRLNS